MAEALSSTDFGGTLAPKLRQRLGFLYDRSKRGLPGTPCRLPGCDGWVEREVRTGRPRWFHDESLCLKRFRRRREALDAAVAELADQLRSSTLTARERYAVRSQLTWLLNVRATYPAIGDWGLGASGDLTAGMDPEEVATLALAADSDRGTQCLACNGTGAQSMRQAALAAIRSYAGALNEVAELLRREKRHAEDAGTEVPDPVTILEREGNRMRDVLKRAPTSRY